MQRPMLMLVDSVLPSLLPEIVASAEADMVVACSVDEALSLAQGRVPEVAVLRPPRSGVDTAQAVRTLRSAPGHATTRTVVIGEGIEQAKQALVAGAIDFWREPLESRTLELGVRALLVRSVSAPAPTADARTVLVADDDVFFLRRVSDVLEAGGYRTLQARSGTEVLRLLEESRPRPAICVMDLFMPGLGGVEVLKRIRETPEWSTLPVIAVSGVRRDKAVIEDLARFGVQDFVDKAIVAIDGIAAIADDTLRDAAGRRKEVRRVSTLALSDFRRSAQEPWLTGVVTNLSAAGAFVRTTLAPEEGQMLHVRLELGPSTRIVTGARVAWTRRREDGWPEPWGMGVEFTSLAEQDERAIDGWIAGPAGRLSA